MGEKGEKEAAVDGPVHWLKILFEVAALIGGGGTLMVHHRLDVLRVATRRELMTRWRESSPDDCNSWIRHEQEGSKMSVQHKGHRLAFRRRPKRCSSQP